MFVLHYLIDICVYAKFNTLYINQLYTCRNRKNFDVNCVIVKMSFKFKIERGMHPSHFLIL